MKASFLFLAFSGLVVTTFSFADSKGDYEKCWGINSCSGKVACGVGKEDVKAANKAFADKYAKATVHDCNGKNACAGKTGQLGWLYVAKGSCEHIAGGFMIEGSGDKKNVPEKFTMQGSMKGMEGKMEMKEMKEEMKGKEGKK